MCLRLSSLSLESNREEWKRLYSFYVERKKETFPDDDILPFDIFKQNYATHFRNPEVIIKMWVVENPRDNEKCCGYLMLMTFSKESPSYKGNEKLAVGNIELFSKYYEAPIEKVLINKTIEFMETHGKEVLILTAAVTQDSKSFFQRLGAKIGLSGTENRLYLDNVNWKMVEEWIREGKQRATKYGSNLKVFTRIPDKMIESFAETYTETYNEQPMGDLDIDQLVFGPGQIRRMEEETSRLGGKKFTAVIIEKDGVVSGLTELTIHPDISYKAIQGLTGVRKQYRGRGYGKWLKAFLLKKVKEDYPNLKYITTGIASTNAPMISINERLGFKKYKETHEAQITLKELQEFITASSVESQ